MDVEERMMSWFTSHVSGSIFKNNHSLFFTQSTCPLPPRVAYFRCLLRIDVAINTKFYICFTWFQSFWIQRKPDQRNKVYLPLFCALLWCDEVLIRPWKTQWSFNNQCVVTSPPNGFPTGYAHMILSFELKLNKMNVSYLRRADRER